MLLLGMSSIRSNKCPDEYKPGIQQRRYLLLSAIAQPLLLGTIMSACLQLKEASLEFSSEIQHVCCRCVLIFASLFLLVRA